MSRNEVGAERKKSKKTNSKKNVARLFSSNVVMALLKNKEENS